MTRSNLYLIMKQIVEPHACLLRIQSHSIKWGLQRIAARESDTMECCQRHHKPKIVQVVAFCSKWCEWGDEMGVVVLSPGSRRRLSKSMDHQQSVIFLSLNEIQITNESKYDLNKRQQ